MSDINQENYLKLLETEQKLEMLRRAYNELAQSYHLLSHIVTSDRHISKKWRACDEPTCRMTVNTLKIIGVE
jgi:hypothetical protein